VTDSPAEVDLAGNVPRYLTTFVGRHAELAALRKLAAESRLVSLIGPGGAGKTRLAAELIRSMARRWPDGIWWVDLAGADESDQVVGAVLAVMDLPGWDQPLQVICKRLAAKKGLVVLDNCERVAGAAANLSKALLECCPDLAVIATSREALGAPGEARSPVESMTPSDSARLFESRATLVAPRFALDAENEAQVSEICRRLDDLPLAVELAASLVDTMAEGEILINLDNRFRVLSGGERTAPSRHQTMTATIDWSYRLLTPDEATLFRRLSVFRGGFDLSAAEAVCGHDLPATVLELLTRLVRKSMAVRERLDNQRSRYRLLESQAAYGLDRLRDSNELLDLQRRHYEYFAKSFGSISNPWFSRDVPEHPLVDEGWKRREAANLWSSLRWARDNVSDLGVSLAVDVFSTHIGETDQARVWLRDLIERSPATGEDRARALVLAAWLAVEKGDWSEALPLAMTASALSQEVGYTRGAALSLNIVGMHHQVSGELERAAREYERALSLLDPVRDWRAAALMRNSIGILASVRGDHTRAREILDECIAEARAGGDEASLAAFLESVGSPLLALGEVKAAGAHWKESLVLARSLSDHWQMVPCLEGLAQVAAAQGQDARAVQLAGAADRMTHEWSIGRDRWSEARLEAALELSRTRLGPSAAEVAWRRGVAMSEEQAAEFALDDAAPEGGVDAGPLSPREMEVAVLVARGMTNREIGEKLFIAERTAEGHVERIRGKLGVRSRAEVAAWTAGRGLAQDEREKGTTVGSPSSKRRPSG
jgi:predicted ATPase/DNA-binding CsgD family transcriptional regulator